MDQQLREDFVNFREAAMDLQNLRVTFEILFNEGDEFAPLLKERAGQFFHDLNKWLVELYFIKIARLLDPAKQGRSTNLTVEYFAGHQDIKALSQGPQIAEVAEKLSGHSARIKDARDKILAHQDLHIARQGQTLGAHTHEDLMDFHNNLQEFCDLVGRAVGEGPLDFRSQAGPGDADDFLRLLKDLTKHQIRI